MRSWVRDTQPWLNGTQLCPAMRLIVNGRRHNEDDIDKYWLRSFRGISLFSPTYNSDENWAAWITTKPRKELFLGSNELKGFRCILFQHRHILQVSGVWRLLHPLWIRQEAQRVGEFIGLEEIGCYYLFMFSFANSLSEEKVRTFKEMFQMFDKECIPWLFQMFRSFVKPESVVLHPLFQGTIIVIRDYKA